MAYTAEHAVQPFVKTRLGRITPDRLRRCATAEAARAMAERLVSDGLAIGALALTRMSDPALGEYDEPDVIAAVGDVPGGEGDLPF